MLILKSEESYIEELSLLQQKFEKLRNEVNQHFKYRRNLAIKYETKLRRSHFYFIKEEHPELLDMYKVNFIIQDIKGYLGKLNKMVENIPSSFKYYEPIFNKY